MKHLEEKEVIEVTISEGQSNKAVVFVETYSEIPCIHIVETDGAVSEAANITVTGCDINAINSKSDTTANTDGRVVKISVCK